MEKGTDTVFDIARHWTFLPEVFCRRPLKAVFALFLNCRHSLSALIGRSCIGGNLACQLSLFQRSTLAMPVWEGPA